MVAFEIPRAPASPPRAGTAGLPSGRYAKRDNAYRIFFVRSDAARRYLWCPMQWLLAVVRGAACTSLTNI